jgi:hypothetical protein
VVLLALLALVVLQVALFLGQKCFAEQVVLHVVLWLGQKHRKVALFLGQFCGQTPVAAP